MSDAGRRKRYDTTGDWEDVAAQDEQSAIEAVVASFDQAISRSTLEQLTRHSLKLSAKQLILDMRTMLMRSLKTRDQNVMAFERILDRLSFNGEGNDPVRAHIVTRLEGERVNIAIDRRKHRQLERALVLLEDWDYRVDQTQTPESAATAWTPAMGGFRLLVPPPGI